VSLMLARRPDIRQAMIQSGSRLCIIGYQEFTTELPGWEWLKPKDFWDARARGMGGSEADPLCSCGEEKLLGYPGDPYAAENILIHEFAHNIHLRGMPRVDPSFDGRVKSAYQAAMAAGLWKGKYASVNHHEYFAEGVHRSGGRSARRPSSAARAPGSPSSSPRGSPRPLPTLASLSRSRSAAVRAEPVEQQPGQLHARGAPAPAAAPRSPDAHAPRPTAFPCGPGSDRQQRCRIHQRSA